MAATFLVIGLGRFGTNLALRLMDQGNEVMVLDRDEERVARIAGEATAACVGDCQDEQVLASLGIRNFDVCFVCVRDDFQSSLETTSQTYPEVCLLGDSHQVNYRIENDHGHT